MTEKYCCSVSMVEMVLYTRKESTQSRGGGGLLTTRNTSHVMCGINLIFAIISNFPLCFSIVRLRLIFFFAINSRLRGTNFIRTTYSELIRFSFLEVCSVLSLGRWPSPLRHLKMLGAKTCPMRYGEGGRIFVSGRIHGSKFRCGKFRGDPWILWILCGKFCGHSQKCCGV